MTYVLDTNAAIRMDRRRESRIKDFDVAIAAHALALGATLVTSNVEHMARVPGIRAFTDPTRRRRWHLG